MEPPIVDEVVQKLLSERQNNFLQVLHDLALYKIELMPIEQQNQMRDESGGPIILTAPVLQSVPKLKDKYLLRVLRYCPISDFYGRTTQELR